MAFIKKPDYVSTIDVEVLDSLTGGDDHIIDELSNEAIEEAKSYLNTRYNVREIFDATGDLRNKTVLMICKDIALFHIYSIYTLRAIPEIRVTRYKNAFMWLENVNKQIINPEGLRLNEKSFVKTGGNEKRENHQQ